MRLLIGTKKTLWSIRTNRLECLKRPTVKSNRAVKQNTCTNRLQDNTTLHFIDFQTASIKKSPKMNKFFVIYLKCKRFLIFPSEWVQNKTLGQESKIYFSPDNKANPDFNAQTRYYFNGAISACYDGFVYRTFGKFLFLLWIQFFISTAMWWMTKTDENFQIHLTKRKHLLEANG